MSEIVRTSIEDVEAIAALERDNFSTPWSKESIREAISKPLYHMFTAKEDGKVVGYAGAYMAADELNITNVVVDASYRRRGIGRMLMQAIVNLAQRQRLSSIYLEVRASNEAARALYREIGFDPAGRRKNYYENPTEDAVLMCYYTD